MRKGFLLIFAFMRARILLLTSFIVLNISPALYAQDSLAIAEKHHPYVFEDLFEREEPLNMTLKFDVKHFQRNRCDEQYEDAEMITILPDSILGLNTVRIKARGIYRRDHCGIPPFWLNIRYAGIEAPELEGIRRMKMVTRCKFSGLYNGYVLREYLVYKLYELVSPCSYRTRLVRLKYIDTGRKMRETVQWAFFIEPDELMAKRTGTMVVKNDKLAMHMINREAMNRLALFQYMVGNGDYSVTGRHNLRILDTGTGGRLGYIPVPYDFDYTGIVNTPYAVPGKALGIKSVRERYFLGPCRNPDAYQVVIDELQGLKEEMEAVIWNLEFLEEEDRLDMIGYIQSFFVTAENKRFIERELESTCR